MKQLLLAVLASAMIVFAVAPSASAIQLCQTTECECLKGYYPQDSPEYNQYCSTFSDSGATAQSNYLVLIIPAAIIFSVTTIAVVGYTYAKKKNNKRKQ